MGARASHAAHGARADDSLLGYSMDTGGRVQEPEGVTGRFLKEEGLGGNECHQRGWGGREQKASTVVPQIQPAPDSSVMCPHLHLP